MESSLFWYLLGVAVGGISGICVGVVSVWFYEDRHPETKLRGF